MWPIFVSECQPQPGRNRAETGQKPGRFIGGNLPQLVPFWLERISPPPPSVIAESLSYGKRSREPQLEEMPQVSRIRRPRYPGPPMEPRPSPRDEPEVGERAGVNKPATSSPPVSVSSLIFRGFVSRSRSIPHFLAISRAVSATHSGDILATTSAKKSHRHDPRRSAKTNSGRRVARLIESTFQQSGIAAN